MGAFVLLVYLVIALGITQVIKFFLTWTPKDSIKHRRWRW